MQAKAIKDKARELGFSNCGIIPAETFTEYRKALDERIEAFPMSEGAYRSLEGQIEPPEGGKSVIVCIMGYNQYKTPENMLDKIGKMYLFDGRLPYTEEHRAGEALSTYLKTLGMRVLEGGIPDRWAAAKAGVGKFGYNNFTYTEEHGSYLIVHTWTVDAVLDYDPVCEDTTAKQCSEDCLLCVSACPTKALCGKFKMNFLQCVPAIATNTHGIPDRETMEQMGEWLYGCDACQDVCPMNARKQTNSEDFPLLAEFAKYTEPAYILAMDEEEYKRVLNPRFWYIGEDGLWLWKCNALRMMINGGDAKYNPLIIEACKHEDARIKKVAEWGRRKLGI